VFRNVFWNMFWNKFGRILSELLWAEDLLVS
jgi:hypothetical protein